MLDFAFQASFADPNGCADRREIEELDDILIFQANAAVAGAASDAGFVIGAVDVNVAVVGVRIVRLGAVQPEDAREHEIILRVHARLPVADGLAGLKDRAARCCITMLFLHDEIPKRCFVASGL